MLFKILHGDASRISTTATSFHEGYCYVTYDGHMYIDMVIDNVETRLKLNANDAETLTGASLSTLLNSSNVEIPTSKAVLDEFAKYTPIERTINGKKLSEDIVLTASDVGADVSGAADTALSSAKTYTDDSLSMTTSLISSHSSNKNNPHGVTKEQLGVYAGIWTGTKAEYDAIATKDADVLYVVTDEDVTSSFEDVSNKTTEISSSSTDLQYPSARAVYSSVTAAQTSLETSIATKLTIPTATIVTLAIASWDTTELTQAVTVSGISANVTTQIVNIAPVASLANMTAVKESGVICIGQGENVLTFACDAVPESDVQFYVSWNDVTYVEDGEVVEEVILSEEGVSF